MAFQINVECGGSCRRLYRTCVVEEETKDTALRLKDLHLNLSEDQKQSFLSRYALYCEAAASRVFLTEKTRDHPAQSKHLDDLLREFEKLIWNEAIRLGCKQANRN